MGIIREKIKKRLESLEFDEAVRKIKKTAEEIVSTKKTEADIDIKYYNDIIKKADFFLENKEKILDFFESITIADIISALPSHRYDFPQFYVLRNKPKELNEQEFLDLTVHVYDILKKVKDGGLSYPKEYFSKNNKLNISYFSETFKQDLVGKDVYKITDNIIFKNVNVSRDEYMPRYIFVMNREKNTQFFTLPLFLKSIKEFNRNDITQFITSGYYWNNYFSPSFVQEFLRFERPGEERSERELINELRIKGLSGVIDEYIELSKKEQIGEEGYNFLQENHFAYYFIRPSKEYEKSLMWRLYHTLVKYWNDIPSYSGLDGLNVFSLNITNMAVMDIHNNNVRTIGGSDLGFLYATTVTEVISSIRPIRIIIGILTYNYFFDIGGFVDIIDSIRTEIFEVNDINKEYIRNMYGAYTSGKSLKEQELKISSGENNVILHGFIYNFVDIISRMLPKDDISVKNILSVINSDKIKDVLKTTPSDTEFTSFAKKIGLNLIKSFNKTRYNDYSIIKVNFNNFVDFGVSSGREAQLRRALSSYYGIIGVCPSILDPFVLAIDNDVIYRELGIDISRKAIKEGDYSRVLNSLYYNYSKINSKEDVAYIRRQGDMLFFSYSAKGNVKKLLAIEKYFSDDENLGKDSDVFVSGKIAFLKSNYKKEQEEEIIKKLKENEVYVDYLFYNSNKEIAKFIMTSYFHTIEERIKSHNGTQTFSMFFYEMINDLIKNAKTSEDKEILDVFYAVPHKKEYNFDKLMKYISSDSKYKYLNSKYTDYFIKKLIEINKIIVNKTSNLDYDTLKKYENEPVLQNYVISYLLNLFYIKFAKEEYYSLLDNLFEEMLGIINNNLFEIFGQEGERQHIFNERIYGTQALFCKELDATRLSLIQS